MNNKKKNQSYGLQKKYQIQDKIAYPHMGKMLKALLKEKRISQAQVARHLGIYSTGVLAYLDQESLQAGILWKISTALDHNILADIAAMHPLSKDAVPQPTPRELELEVYKRITGK